MNPGIERRTRSLFAWIACVPLLLAFLGFWAEAEYRRTSALVEHTHRVLSTIDSVLDLLTRAETGQRGFVLTGLESYLVPFEKSSAEIGTQIADLRQLTADNAKQQGHLRRLEVVASEKLSELRETIELRRNRGFEAALAIVRTNRGRVLMDQAAETARVMEAHEQELLQQREVVQRRMNRTFNALYVMGSVAIILLVVWTSALIRRYEVDRDIAGQRTTVLNSALEQRVNEINQLNRDLESRVQARTADLKRSNDDLEHFAYVASHDLQEPLRMVAAYVALLGRKYRGRLDENADRFIGFAVEGATRMQALIADLLAYSQAGTQTLNITPVRMTDVVTEVLGNVRSGIDESGAVIEVGELPVLNADRMKVGLVLQNLITNAIKFRNPERTLRIRIEAEPGEHEYRFTVRDNGIGFDQRYAHRIFQMFQRLHGAGEYQGTGIGLALSKRIIEGHGGGIWAESTPGEGATFYFTLPISQKSNCEPETLAGTATRS